MAIESLADAHDVFARRFNRGDLDGLLELYDDRAKMVLPEGEVSGKEAIREALERLIALKGQMRMERVGVVEGEDVAISNGTWRLEAEDGKILTQGESVEVYRKGPNGWLAIVDCPFGVG